jgi:hypothetical protein
VRGAWKNSATPVPTTTPTPAPTPAPSIAPTPAPTPSFVYTVDHYTCDTPSGPCTNLETPIVISNPTTLIEAKFYFDNTSGYIFNIVSSGGSGPYLYTNMSGAGTNSCNSLCSITPAPTTALVFVVVAENTPLPLIVP